MNSHLQTLPQPGDVHVLIGSDSRYTQLDFEAASARTANQLRGMGVRVLASWSDNSPEWAILDHATTLADVVHIPLPLFFSKEQMAYVLHRVGTDALLTTRDIAYEWPDANREEISIEGHVFVLHRKSDAQPVLPRGTSKITFTSGTTGRPKGVCLSLHALHAVADGVEQALKSLGIHRHLCALPFPVLLENVAGLMAALRHGHTCITPSLAQVGLQGSSHFDPSRLDACIREHEANSLILLPQMLLAWTHWLQAKHLKEPPSLVFVAVGGGKVSSKTIAHARSLGIPAYEGYGLSEGASVQTLNLPGNDSLGSVGKPLPHAYLRTNALQEIEISGSLFLGYLEDATTWNHTWFPTGDLGHIDARGFVYITGRSKNVLITAFGRNVSPEWVESVLHDEADIVQAVVFGDGQPNLWAVIWSPSDIDTATINRAVTSANQQLPDYAQIAHWVRAQHAFTSENGMATANGRPLRSNIESMHSHAMNTSQAGV